MALLGLRRNKRNVSKRFNYNGNGWSEENNEFEIRKPFGPSIYFGKFTQEELDLLRKLSYDAKDAAEAMGQTLSGNIKGQYDLKNVGSPDEQKQFVEIMSRHCNNFIRNGLQVSNLDEMPSEEEHDLLIQLQGYPWVNFSQAGEFNPMHTHPESVISASLYVDIPEEIAQEKEPAREYTNQPVPGDITFSGGLIDDIWQSSGVNYTPKTGDCIFFPGAMRHAVYPFKSDVTRITMSFNIAQFGFVRKDSKVSAPYRMWVNNYDY